MSPDEPVSARSVAALAWTDLRRSWRRLLAVDLLFKLLAFAVLTPAVGVALRLGIAAAGDPVLADLEILFFLLRPVGLLVLILVAALSVAIIALEQTCLMAIGAAAIDGERLEAGRVLRFLLARSRVVVRLALRLVARILLGSLPFLAGLALVYFGLLREFDINYYLHQRPPAFLVALLLAAGLVAGWAWVLLPRLVAWSLALPLALFEGAKPAEAFRESARRTADHRRAITGLWIGWALGAILISSLVPGLLFAIARAAAPHGLGNVGWVLGLMLGIGALGLIANLLISWWNAASFALLVVRLHRRLGGAAGPAEGSAETAPELRVRRLTFRSALTALLLLTLLAGGLGAYLLRGMRGNGDVVVISHRGASAAAPENTLAAIDRALEEGTDYVEIDVQETADDEIAVLHDSDLMKVGGVDLKIWDATRERLAAIDIGSWFGPEFHGERVPSLREVLERARGKARVVIELKYYGHTRQLEQRVVDLVEELGMADETVAMSLEYPAVQKLKALRPNWTVGLLTAKAVGDLTRLDADFLAVNAGIADRRFVARAHAKGKQVYVWTINDPVQMFRLLNLGVDGLITDRPAVARWVIERRSRMNAAERLLVGLAFYFGAAAPDPPASVDAP